MNHVRSLAFCRSRGETERLLLRARSHLEKRGGDPGWLDSYRGGYTAKERREIEQALFKGRLRGLTTTNAMELGVDVGGLDAVIMNGYPGSVSSFWQQSGRAGRGSRDGLTVMLTGNDPLEQFFVREPHLLLDKPIEGATINLGNPHILSAQLRCAAYERPVGEEELDSFTSNAREIADQMVDAGELVWQAGRLFFPSYENPAKSVNIRGVGGDAILLLVDDQPLGQMEYWRALVEAHAEATYLHRGVSYVVQQLDLSRKLARLVQADPPYFTVARTQMLVETTHVLREADQIKLCAVRVTTSVPGFARIDRRSRAVLSEEALDLPVNTFDSVGVRLELPELTIEESPTVHAIEHALVTVAPLIAGCDRRDIASCWFVMSPETMAPALYVYDQAPGGVGLAERLYSERLEWFAQAHALLDSCSCQDGCPACLLIPQCANQGLDKRGAKSWLSSFLHSEAKS